MLNTHGNISVVASGFEVVDFFKIVGALDHDSTSLLVVEGGIAVTVAEGASGDGCLRFSACVLVGVLVNCARCVLKDAAEGLRLVLGLPCLSVCKVNNEAGELITMSGDEGDCLVDCFRAREHLSGAMEYSIEVIDEFARLIGKVRGWLCWRCSLHRLVVVLGNKGK